MRARAVIRLTKKDAWSITEQRIVSLLGPLDTLHDSILGLIMSYAVRRRYPESPRQAQIDRAVRIRPGKNEMGATGLRTH
jgi:hypothetical protein